MSRKKLMTFFGFLVGVAALIIIWLVVVKPIISSDNKKEDEIAQTDTGNTGSDVESSLDNAVVDQEKKPSGSSSKNENKNKNKDKEKDNSAAAVANGNGNLPTTGATENAVTIVSVFGLAAVVYLVSLNLQLRKEMKSLTYKSR